MGRKRFKFGRDTCYMCERVAISREHAPPLSFFPEDKRVNLITVPSCSVHNYDHHENVIYARGVIVTDINSNEVARELFASKVRRAYKNNPKLTRQTFQQIRPVKIGGEDTVIIRLNRTRFNPIIRGIAHALFFHDFGQKFQYRWIVYSATMLSEAQAFHDMPDNYSPYIRAMLRSAPVVDRDTNQPEVFKYGVLRQKEHEVIYRLVFYGGVDVYAIGIPNKAAEVFE